MNRKNLKICIVMRENYPFGMACTNRIHLYARGLIKEGYKVKIIIPTPLEQPEQIWNYDQQGIFEGVPFEYSWPTPVRSRSFWGRRLHDVIAPFRAGMKLYKEKPDIVLIIVGNKTFLLVLYWIITKLSGGKYVQEKSELPFFRSASLNYWQRFQVRLVYSLFDGVVAISDVLMKYFSFFLHRKNLLKVPVIVDVGSIYDPTVTREKSIVYTGPLTQHKDGILTIIESFANIADEFPGYTLEMTGNLSTSPVKKEIEELMEKYQLWPRVRFWGIVDRENLLKILNRASVLVLAKPFNRQASACFPTKLGEYLATGNPVLVTRAGEISQYLEDGVTAFLAEPTVNAFTERLRDILSNLDGAKVVGRSGKALAKEKFDVVSHTFRLGAFFESLCTDK